MEFWYRYFMNKKTFNAIIGVGVFSTILVGTLVLILVSGWLALDTEQNQTGWRGTGMVGALVPEDEWDPQAAEAEYEQVMEVWAPGPPIPPAEGEELAKDVYENVQVLGDVTVANFNRVMSAITAWVSPEQGCAYCHGNQGNFASDAYWTKMVARRMIQMTQTINEGWNAHVAAYPNQDGNDGNQVGVNCYTCHRGQNNPQYRWYVEPLPEAAHRIGEHTLVQNRADEDVGYASLPGDPLTKYFLEAYPIRVGGEEPRVSEPYADQAKWQDTEWTYSLMFHFSYSLGVNCTYCHNSRAWNSWEQSPPTRVKAWYAVRMLRDVNRNYMHNLGYYPPELIGPLGDAPKSNCTTCHYGVNKPVYGLNMVRDWPELTTTGVPDYSAFTDQQAEAPAEFDHATAGLGTAD